MNNPYQVPAEMRDLAEKSVKQAREAFEGFMGAVQSGAGKFNESASTASSGFQTVSGQAVSFAESNVKAAFDLAEKLCHAKDVQDVVALQSEFLKTQMNAFQTQAQALGEAVQKAAKAGK